MDAANRSVEYPENVPRLYDLIRVKDERVKPAFYHGVRETLVATDLDQATRIGYGRVRYRIITLKGERHFVILFSFFLGDLNLKKKTFASSRRPY